MRFDDSNGNRPLLLVVLIVILVFAMGIREALDKPGETFTQAVFCMDSAGVEHCHNLQEWIDGKAPSWMYDSY